MAPPDPDAITRRLCDHLTARPAWDEPPALLAITPHSAQGCVLEPVPVPGLASEHPAVVIEELARAAAGGPRPAAPDMWGLALRWEAFTAPLTTRTRRCIDAATPDSLEVRVASAADTGGRRYMFEQRRDTGEVGELFVTAAGRVPAALERLLAALT